MSFPNLEIIKVMPRGDFECPGAKLRIHKRIGDDWNGAANDGEGNRSANKFQIAFVLRVDGYRRVPEHRLRPCCCHHQAF